MATIPRTLVVIGSGPGIGRSMATLFASKRYCNVALIARRENQLKIDQDAIQKAAGKHVRVRIYTLDVVDSESLFKAMDDIGAHFGEPECIFYNAAQALPPQLLDHNGKEIDYDMKINVSALHAVAQRHIPRLIDMAKNDPSSRPSFLVTSSLLPLHPVPQLFALSLVKAAQRNLLQGIAVTYASQGVHIGLITVGGRVSTTEKERNPANIAAQTWKWLAESQWPPPFEVEI